MIPLTLMHFSPVSTAGSAGEPMDGKQWVVVEVDVVRQEEAYPEEDPWECAVVQWADLEQDLAEGLVLQDM